MIARLLRWLRIRIASHQLEGARLDRLFWEAEVERCLANVGIAQTRIEQRRKALTNARTPLLSRRAHRITSGKRVRI